MPSAANAPAPRAQRAPDRWRAAGIALLAVWGALIVVVVLWWVHIAFYSGPDEDPHGYTRLLGAPMVPVAFGMLWWVWWSARALRRGRPEGWHALIVLGGGAAFMSATFLLAAYGLAEIDLGPTDVPHPGVPLSFLAEQLGVLAIGLVSVVVATLARRAWATDAAATPAGSATTEGLSDRG